MENSGGSIIEMKNVYKRFVHGTKTINILNGISLKISPGEFCMITGRSGSGKSTTLNVMSGLLKPSSGEVIVEGKNIWSMSEEKRMLFRRKYIGNVFQAFNLIQDVKAVENVAMPLEFRGVPAGIRIRKAEEVMEELGIKELASHFPKNMSGGEQQRTAIARAVITDPEIIFADEPTGNLDSESARAVMDIFGRLVREKKKTVIMVTHDISLTDCADSVISVDDGRIRSA